MKRFLTLLATFCTIITCCFIAACRDNEPIKADENTVIITASDSSFEFENKTLKDYMEYLQDNEKLTFSISNGMVTAINGKSNTNNSYWMLYTSDSENANHAWGTFEYEDSIYGSAIVGADSLILKKDSIYIWAYQTF